MVEIGLAVAELRKLLAIPAPDRDPNWQIVVGSLIGALCVDFSKQDDSAVALVQISLVALATRKGSTEAKRRALKPTRWISSIPPGLSELFENIDEVRAAIRVLQPIRADWVESYVAGELAKNKWPILTVSLVTWLLKTTPTIEHFFHALNGTSPPSGVTYAGWVAIVFQTAAKVLAKSQPPAGDGLMAEVAESAMRINAPPIAGLASLYQTEQQKARRALIALVSQISSLEPSILVQGAGIAAISSLGVSTGSKVSVVVPDFEILCKRTINLLTVLIPAADQTHLKHYREIWRTYRERLPTKADQLLKNAAKSAPSLTILQSAAEDNAVIPDLGVTAGLEAVLCELVVNWDDYYTHHMDDPAAQQLCARIDELIRQLGVARFGDADQVLPFDPIRHHLSDKSSATPSKVKITKPGLLLERSDGTSRVLLMAVVSPVPAH